MLGSNVLEIALGLALLYTLLSMLCSGISQGIADLLSLRAKSLRLAVERLVGDETLAARVYANPLVTALADDKGKLPSDLPPTILAAAVIEELGAGSSSEEGSDPLAGLREALGRCDRSQCPLPLVLAGKALSSVENARASLAAWFDRSAERASASYRRNMRGIELVVALGLSVLPNVDSFRVAEALAREPTLRAAIVAASEEGKRSLPRGVEAGATPITAAIQIERELASIPFPIGWKGSSVDGVAGLGRLLWRHGAGWLATALAVSMGAPFWTAMLERILNLIRLGRPRREPASEEGASA